MDVLHESRHMSCATAESLLCDASVPARSRDEWKNPPFLPNWASTAGRPRASCPSPSPEKLFILFGLKYMQSDPLTSIPICICILADFFSSQNYWVYSTSTGSAPVAWYNDMDNKMLMCLADMDIYRLFVIVHCLIGQLACWDI